MNNNSSKKNLHRRDFVKGIGGVAAATAVTGFPAIVRAQNTGPIKIGVSSIMSGRVAQLGSSSTNGAKLGVDAFNAAGGLNGRMIELIIRDSKGKPDEAARINRDFINRDDCDMILSLEASTGAFAVQEVVRELGTLCMHCLSETSSLTADPKLRTANAFRSGRQGAHDAISAGSYAAGIAKEKGLKKWMTVGPNYAYGHDTTEQFLKYLNHFSSDVELGSQLWPKIFQPDYTDVINKILQEKPDAVFTCLWGGDLSSFIEQGNLYGLFDQAQYFCIALADYTTMAAVKNLPTGLHSGNRYVSTFPGSAANAAWEAAYVNKFGSRPTNWSWEAALGMQYLIEGMKKTGTSDGNEIARVLPGMVVQSPFGVDGTITMRAEDQTVVEYGTGWGVTQSSEPFMPDVAATDWKLIYELEAAWKKEQGYI